MSLILKIGISVALTTGIFYQALGTYAEKNYPPKGSSYKEGDTYIDEAGRSKTFIGYTGHHATTLKEIDHSRDLYYTSNKSIAQRYAYINGHEKGAVGHVIGDSLPTYHDHGSARFEGVHTPLSSDGMKRLNIKILHPEPVTHETKLGKFTAIKRMIGKTGL